jgi:hypothetical protein
VTNIADDVDCTFISQKIAYAVLKPLLEEHISTSWKKIFNLKEEWFT